MRRVSMMLEPLGEVGTNFSLQLLSQKQFTKINNKNVIAKNQCEKHKKSSFFFLIMRQRSIESTTITYDKLYCVLKSQLCIAYQSIYLYIFLYLSNVMNMTIFTKEQCINTVFILWPIDDRH